MIISPQPNLYIKCIHYHYPPLTLLLLPPKEVFTVKASKRLYKCVYILVCMFIGKVIQQKQLIIFTGDCYCQNKSRYFNNKALIRDLMFIENLIVIELMAGN